MALRPDDALVPAENMVERRCIATGRSGPTGTMVRFVVGPGDRVVPDVAGKLPGRGLWVSATRSAVERAVAQRLFARAAKATALAERDLADKVEALLARRCLEHLGLAKRAGLAVAGFEKVREALRRGQVSVLLAASDGAPEGRRRLRRLAPAIPLVELLTSAELSLALGRENVIHAALAAGGLADRFVAESMRLAGFRPVVPPSDAAELELE